MVLLRLVGLIQPALSIWFELRALGHLQLQLACVSSFSEKRFPGSILVLVAVFIIKWGHSEYPVDLAGTCARGGTSSGLCKVCMHTHYISAHVRTPATASCVYLI